jgi:alpha-1,6-mannosyltransferase
MLDIATDRRCDGSVDGQLIVCDLTQSWSPTGGGISTYLREKRDYVLRHTPHHLLQIVPGPRDSVAVNGRHIFAQVGSDPVRGSPNYRFILRTRIVRQLLTQYRPDVIESLCPWVLPWTAINHRKAYPETALVAGYRTDFPNAHVYRVGAAMLGEPIGRALQWLSYGYAEITYREFDHVYTLSEAARQSLARRKIRRSEVLPLGVDADLFTPAARDPRFRDEVGLPGGGPLLIYAGRLDREKRVDQLVEMMRALPEAFGASLVIIGDGRLRGDLEAAARDLPIRIMGYESDRRALARALASSDIYVSAMADETFGISVLEAQAAGLPVVGVAGGAMIDRVPPGLGYLGPIGDVDAMARNVQAVWRERAAEMGAAARDHVADRYTWQQTFDRLFGTIYPKALRHAHARAGSGRGWRFGGVDQELVTAG